MTNRSRARRWLDSGYYDSDKVASLADLLDAAERRGARRAIPLAKEPAKAQPVR